MNNSITINSSTFAHFLIAENKMFLFYYTENLQETQMRLFVFFF